MVIGLGNPGRKYAGTRHNVGFDVVALLAGQFSGSRWRAQFEAETSEIQIGDERVLLVAPQTYMNLSGRSVRRVVDFYKPALADLLVVCDDLNLPCGRLRLRASGSDGGQKGLRNTIDQLGTDEFPRLRIGIGRPSGRVDATNYVLQTFSKAERTVIDDAIQRAAKAVETWVRDGLDVAMNQFNRIETSPSDG